MNRLQTILRCLVAAALLIGGSARLSVGATAEEAPALGDAIRWVPEDAALCGAVLRVREQVEAAGDTRAWGRLAGMPIWRQLAEAWDLPATQLARELLYAKLTEPGTTGAQMDVLLNDPQLQRLAELSLDMFDEEFVWYADASAVDFLRLVSPGEPLHLAIGLEDGAPDPREVQRALSRQVAERLAQSLAERETPLVLPSVVWAFRVSDVPRAAEQLGKIELAGSLLCWTRPELRGRLSRRGVAGQSFMTLSLNGRMAAEWLGQYLASLDVEAEAAEQLVAAASDLPLVVALGMRQDYLVLAIGPSLEAIEVMLAGDNRLVDRPELAPLRDALRQRLTGLAYASPAMAAALRETAGPPAHAACVEELGPILSYST
ncbi:MAG: hypothetical protein U1E05_15970, partial [Patescibacteria group bacterium]|nr:hypothetical protein [Patescibacteria group bacterium]